MFQLANTVSGLFRILSAALKNLSAPVKQDKIFEPCPAKLLLAVVGCIFFVLAGLIIENTNPWLSKAVVLLFGTFGVIGLVKLVKGKGLLRLDQHGFEFDGVFIRHRYRWKDIESIRMMKIRGVSVLAFNFRKGHPRRSQFSRSLIGGGMDGTLGNGYTVPLQDVCETMKEWHERYADANSPAPLTSGL